MRAMNVPLSESRAVFVEQTGQFVSACEGLVGMDLLDPSRCRGWSRLDLAVHVRLGLDEMAATAGVYTDRAPDHDAATYWSSDPHDGEDQVPHVLWLRRTASAYGRPEAAVRHLSDAGNRGIAVIEQVPDRPVLFQGKAMTMGDFVATWAVELAVHHLDLDCDGTPAGAALARRTVEAIAEARLPATLDDCAAVLAGLGRVPWPEHSVNPAPFPVSL